MDKIQDSASRIITDVIASDFIKEAETAFNAQNIQATCDCYAEEAILEFYSGGVYEQVQGKEMIQTAWSTIFKAIPAFRLKKILLATEDYLLINEWVGSIDKKGKTQSQGIEWWKFNESGKVKHHRLYNFLRIKRGDTLAGKLKFGLMHPIIGMLIEIERHKS